jgi:hypothetical protein
LKTIFEGSGPLRIKKTAPIIIIGFIMAIFFSFIAIAAIDAPHNARTTYPVEAVKAKP